MKFLGRGWQYSVYDIGNGRVMKKYNTWLEAYIVMLKDAFAHLRPPVVCFSKYYYEGRALAQSSLKKLSELPLEQWMFGNPKIVGMYEYEQDFAESLATHLKRISDAERKQAIDKFAEFAKLLLTHSIVEKNFNIGDNFGLNNQKQVILIDIGEILFGKEEILEQIKKRVWAAPDVLSRIPESLRSYFVARMDDTLIGSQ